jgi:hypothetical protein
MIMLYQILNLMTGVVLVVAVGIIILIVIKAKFKSASTTLFTEGYILTHPTRKAVAFDNAIDAKGYVNLCKNAGIHWSCHILYNGKLNQIDFD